MTCLFADPLAGRPKRRLLPSRRDTLPHKWARNNRVLVRTEREAKMRRLSPPYQCPVAKQQPLNRNLLRRCPPLVMRIATSNSDRERRLTDEAFRTQVGELSAGSSGWLFRVSRLWHSGASLRASRRRGVSGRFLRET